MNHFEIKRWMEKNVREADCVRQCSCYRGESLCRPICCLQKEVNIEDSAQVCGRAHVPVTVCECDSRPPREWAVPANTELPQQGDAS